MSFSGKVVIITGGGSGIGAGTACHLSKLGASIAIVDKNAKGLSEVAADIVKSGCPKPLSIVADVTKDHQRIIDETIQHFGRLDVLVNNAGIAFTDNVIECNSNEFDRMININLKSVMFLTSSAVPHLEKTKGNVINVTSIAGTKAEGAFTTYCISKAGLHTLTKCSAITLAPKGIRVNSVEPGIIQTNLIASLVGADADAAVEQVKKHTLVGRIGHVTDISSAIAYLASESFVNGTSLVVDGGYLCAI